MSDFKDELLAQAGGDPLMAAIATSFRLMQGDLKTLKSGYSIENATLAAAELFEVDVADVANGVLEAMTATMESLYDVLREAPSLETPQETPSDHCYTVLQDFGPRGGGWGPAAVIIPGVTNEPQLFVYTGDSREVIQRMTALCRSLAQETGRPTRFVRFTQREDVAFFGGSS